MKDYPSIPKDIRTDINIFAFDKLDGSNIRAEWSKQKGFYKFGSKTRLLGEDDLQLGEAIGLIHQLYGEGLAKIFTDARYERAISFFEFYGPRSSAGWHHAEPHTVTLIDVNPYKKGIMEPSAFIDTFEKLGIPRVLYYGKANSMFVESVRERTLEGMGLEGVICKAKNDKRTPKPIMFKIKSREWLRQLKEHCKGDEALFEQLA